jgi:hypothetical protein
VTPITAAILAPEQYKTGVSMLLLFNIVSIFAISIASAIETAAHAQPYLVYKLFTGIAYLVAGVILVLLKLKMTKGLLTRI